MDDNKIKSITLNDGDESFTFDNLSIEKRWFGRSILVGTEETENLPALIVALLDFGVSAEDIAELVLRNGIKISPTVEVFLHKHVDLDCIVGLIKYSSYAYIDYCVKQFIENGYAPEEIAESLMKHEMLTGEYCDYLVSKGLDLTTLFQKMNSSTVKKLFDKLIATGTPINDILDKIDGSCWWCARKGIDEFLKNGASPEAVLKAMLPTWAWHAVDQEYAHEIFTAISKNKTDVLYSEIKDDDGPLLIQAEAIMLFTVGYLKFIESQRE